MGNSCATGIPYGFRVLQPPISSHDLLIHQGILHGHQYPDGRPPDSRLDSNADENNSNMSFVASGLGPYGNNQEDSDIQLDEFDNNQDVLDPPWPPDILPDEEPYFGPHDFLTHQGISHSRWEPPPATLYPSQPLPGILPDEALHFGPADSRDLLIHQGIINGHQEPPPDHWLPDNDLATHPVPADGHHDRNDVPWDPDPCDNNLDNIALCPYNNQEDSDICLDDSGNNNNPMANLPVDLCTNNQEETAIHLDPFPTGVHPL